MEFWQAISISVIWVVSGLTVVYALKKDHLGAVWLFVITLIATYAIMGK